MDLKLRFSRFRKKRYEFEVKFFEISKKIDTELDLRFLSLGQKKDTDYIRICTPLPFCV